jgi:hypothetical protein
VEFGEDGINQNTAFTIAGLPDIGQVVDSLTPLKELE